MSLCTAIRGFISSEPANRKDLTIIFFQFFDHYLKDAPAPEWMTKAVSYLNKEVNREKRDADDLADLFD